MIKITLRRAATHDAIYKSIGVDSSSD